MSIASMFSKSRVGYIGLDISNTAIEAVQLEGVPGGKNFKVRGWSRVLLPPGTIHNGKLLKPEAFMDPLKKLFSRPSFGSLDSKNVVLSFPEHQCYHFQLTKPLGGVSVFQEVQKQAVSQIPFPLNEVLWDWDQVAVEKNIGYYYGVAIPKEVISSYQKVFKQVGLRVTIIEPQVHAAARFLWPSLPIKEPVLYIDIGGEETMVSVVDDLGVHQSSVVGAGALDWYKTVAKKIKTPLPKAAQIARTIGLRKIKHPKAELIHKVLQEGVNEIVKEANQHLTYFSTRKHPDPKILKTLIVGGGGAVIPGIQEILAKQLVLTQEPIEPWMHAKPAFNPAMNLELSHSIGAALRGVATTDAGKIGLNVLRTRKAISSKKGSFWKKKK